MDYGQRVRYFRTASNISGKALAKMAGLDPSQINKIEHNVTKPSLTSLERICTALGITLSEFFADTQEQEPLPPEIRQIVTKVQKLSPRQLKILNDVLDEWIEPKGE